LRDLAPTNNKEMIRRDRHALPQTLVVISAVLSCGIVVILLLQMIGVLPPVRQEVFGDRPGLSIDYVLSHLIFSTPYVIILSLLIVIHALVLWGVRRGSYRYAAAVAATVVLLLISIVTGFTVGPYLFPSVILLTVALVTSVWGHRRASVNSLQSVESSLK
jgi:cytochrome bd-type quinol oxidase subunit 2